MSNFTFIKEHTKLKTIKRFNLGEPGRQENSAEHSWSVALLCMVLFESFKEEYPDISIAKMLKMAIIHDLVEIYADDVSAWNISNSANKQEKEEAAADKLFGLLDVTTMKEFKSLWREFEDITTDEAKLVKGVDRISGAIQRLVTGPGWKSMGKTEADLDALQLPRIGVSKTLLEIYNELKKEARSKNLLGDS